MNLIILYAIFCFRTTLAFQVSFHEGNQTSFSYDAVGSLVCTPHKFMYQRGDKFAMDMLVLNNRLTVSVTEYRAFIKTCQGIKDCRASYNPGSKIILQTQQITIDVELLTKDGCLRETILEGREMPANAPDKGNKYNDICIKENDCIAIVNKAKECRSMKPQPCEETSNRMPRSSTPAPLDKHDESLNETYKMLEVLFTAINIFNSPESPTRNISMTSSSTGAETSYFTVMIITSVTAAVALILLLVIAFKRFCRKTYNSPGLPQNPANENRYYENMLFREECQQQIEQLEQRALEDPQPSELQYEEIDNRSNRWRVLNENLSARRTANTFGSPPPADRVDERCSVRIT